MGNILMGSNGDFIKRKIIFAPPPHDAVVKIINIKDDVIVESAEVVESDFVLVKGYLNKSIEYNTTNRATLNRLMGNEEGEKEESKEDENKEEEKDDKKRKKEVVCESVVTEVQPMAVDGVVRHTTVWIPFNILVKVEGAILGDKVSVETPNLQQLNRQNEFNEIRNEIREDGLIIGMLVNDVVNVTVKIIEAPQASKNPERLI